MKPDLLWLPLEPYQARYTELMSSEDGWTQKKLGALFNLRRIAPDDAQATTVIQNGQVLDSVNRPLWALKQIELLLANAPVGGKVFLEDFFHPGVEALPYSGRDFKLYSFCWAQTFDQYDFTRAMPWMRAYESMMLSVARKTFVASPLLQDLIMCAFPSLTQNEVVYTGLPFDSESVRKIYDPKMQPDPIEVVFASRFDKEKQPMFFLDVVETGNFKAAVCTGHEQLRGTDYTAVGRALDLESKGKLTIYKNLTKPEYYSVLKASHVQFNCSLQDWVSFTLLEALTHGCLPVYPNFRDFTHVFRYQPQSLYVPWEVDDAVETVGDMLQWPRDNSSLSPILEFHDKTYERIADVILADN